jgi:histidinol-phosphate aminotransferase
MRAALEESHRYPDSQYDLLVNRVAALHKVEPHQVLTGCGSTEILRISTDAFLAPGKKLIMAAPTFEAIDMYARPTGAEIIRLPLTKDYAHDLEAMLARMGSSAGVIYICSPNNPTGSLTPRKDIEAFLGKLNPAAYVLIDEAYHHFTTGAHDYKSFLDSPVDDARVIVARTFSKIYGMAGVRLGYGISHPATIQKMRPFQQQDNVNMLAARAGVIALDDAAGIEAAVERNARDRAEFMGQAEARRLKPIPSYGNFVMMDASRPAPDVIEHFKRNHILVGRRFPPVETFVRVSLGTPDEMKEFWRIWDLLPRKA